MSTTPEIRTEPRVVNEPKPRKVKRAKATTGAPVAAPYRPNTSIVTEPRSAESRTGRRALTTEDKNVRLTLRDIGLMKIDLRRYQSRRDSTGLGILKREKRIQKLQRELETYIASVQECLAVATLRQARQLLGRGAVPVNPDRHITGETRRIDGRLFKARVTWVAVPHGDAPPLFDEESGDWIR